MKENKFGLNWAYINQVNFIWTAAAKFNALHRTYTVKKSVKVQYNVPFSFFTDIFTYFIPHIEFNIYHLWKPA